MAVEHRSRQGHGDNVHHVADDATRVMQPTHHRPRTRTILNCRTCPGTGQREIPQITGQLSESLRVQDRDFAVAGSERPQILKSDAGPESGSTVVCSGGGRRGGHSGTVTS